MGVSDRATTLEKKKAVMKRLYRLWLRNPDLRLSQLIENVYHHTSTNHCLYHVEDFDLIQALEEYYDTKKKKQLPN